MEPFSNISISTTNHLSTNRFSATVASIPKVFRLVIIFSLSVPSVVAQVPYHPTTILRNDSLLYIFRPQSSTSAQYELASIKIDSKLYSAHPNPTIINPTLPFLDSNRRAFTPVLGEGGNITVYTGDCDRGAEGAQVWSYVTGASGELSDGAWRQAEVSFSADQVYPTTVGPNYLNGGISFSSLVNADVLTTDAYFFGGMCPTDYLEDDWQSSANYSNTMVTLQPANTGTMATNYRLDVSSSRGPPIAEAGFTLTGLEPASTNKSDGTQTQQQNFVLLGGHTRNAFINMSQVALFALPQQSWNFLTIEKPDPEGKDVRTDVAEIESRSGHTAVLTPDGQRIVVFGGWVGDLNTPAYPQLAILHVGDSFGGQGAWKWTAPTTSGSGLPDNRGVFGHGAVMLPGGVMMITGGYSMDPSDSLHKRDGLAMNIQTLLLDVDTNTWISEYDPPSRSTPSEEAQAGPLSKPSQKAGLGAGLGIGAAAVIGLFAFYVWYTRRLKRQRDIREKQLHDLALSAHRYTFEPLTPGLDGRGGHLDAVDYFDDPHDPFSSSATRNRQNQGWRRGKGQEAERTGLLVEIPSPTRGLRRSLGGRTNPHLSGGYNEKRGRGSGHIHPIDELEEEEQEHGGENDPVASKVEMAEKSRASLFNSAPNLQPSYNRPSSMSNVPTSEGAMNPRDTNSELLLAVGPSLGRHSPSNSLGRISPTKSERTRSDLSDRSARSDLSTSTSASLGRSLSLRSAVLMNSMNPFRTPQDSPTADRTPSSYSVNGWNSPVDSRTRSFTSSRSTRPNTANAEVDSFTTAKTSFMQLQAEGEALLGGNPERHLAGRPGTGSNSLHSYANTSPGAEIFPKSAMRAAESPTRSTRPRRKSWLGSVRRVLGRSSSMSGSTDVRNTVAISAFEPYRDAAPSPTRRDHQSARFSQLYSGAGSSPPRRAVSDASLWRSKRGKKDWMEDDEHEARWRRNSGDDWGAPEDRAERERGRSRSSRRGGTASSFEDGEDDDEEDWDVEAAVERRVVQVMFTVPRSRLRVVNAEVGGDDSSIMDGKGLGEEKEDGTPSKAQGSSASGSGSPGKVRDLVDLFQNQEIKCKSPASSIRSAKSARSLASKAKMEGS